MIDPLSIHRARQTTRRHFLNQAGALGIGSIALSNLLNGGVASAAVSSTSSEKTNPLTPRSSPQTPKAKRVIFLHMSGGPPHLDMFDYKPELVKHNDENCPDSML